MRSKAAGITLISVLVAMAILSLLSLTLISIFGNMTNLVIRTNMTSDADNMIRYVQLLLSQSAICDNALVDGAGAKLFWPVLTTPAPVDHIQVWSGSVVPAPTVAVKTGETLVPGLVVKKIWLRQPDPTLGEGQPNVQTSIQQNGKTYTVTSAKVQFDFDPVAYAQVYGGAVASRSADVIVMVQSTLGPLVGQVSYCYQGQKVQTINSPCTVGTDLYTGSSNDIVTYPTHLGDCAGPFPFPNCKALYYVVGFDDTGKSICACKTTCADTGMAGTGAGALPKAVGQKFPVPGSWTAPTAPTAPYNSNGF
jgi:hypothetical protein